MWVLLLAACGSVRQDAAGTVGSSTAVTSSMSSDRSTVTTDAPTTTGTSGAGSATTVPGLSVPEPGSMPDEVILTCDGTGATLSADAVLTRPMAST